MIIINGKDILEYFKQLEDDEQSWYIELYVGDKVYTIANLEKWKADYILNELYRCETNQKDLELGDTWKELK